MTISIDTQIRYLIQWFTEWSELQRSDFLPVMIENIGAKPYVNGIINSISNVDCQDKPMSLFQCRIKLFKEWCPNWSLDQKEHFMKQVIEIDPSFGDKLKSENGLENGENGIEHAETNGINEEILED